MGRISTLKMMHEEWLRKGSERRPDVACALNVRANFPLMTDEARATPSRWQFVPSLTLFGYSHAVLLSDLDLEHRTWVIWYCIRM